LHVSLPPKFKFNSQKMDQKQTQSEAIIRENELLIYVLELALLQKRMDQKINLISKKLERLKNKPKIHCKNYTHINGDVDCASSGSGSMHIIQNSECDHKAMLRRYVIGEVVSICAICSRPFGICVNCKKEACPYCNK